MKDYLWEISKLFRLRFFYLATKTSAKRITAFYVLLTGFLSLSVIGAVAYLLNWPLLFPSLAPTAFLIFYAPARPMSWPKNALLGHLIALVTGFLFFLILKELFPKEVVASELDITKTVLVSAAVAVSALLMVCLDILHPPAASTAMFAAAGYFENPAEVVGFLVALAILVAEGIVFHKVAGIVYPVWKDEASSEGAPVKTKLGELSETPADQDPYAKLAHKITTRRS